MFGMDQNPFMNMWMQSLQGFMPQPAQPQNPLAQMQQNFQQNLQAWQNIFMPQSAHAPVPSFPSPKITVMTIELGDMKPYMEAAQTMLAWWQPQMLKMMGQR